MTESLLQQIIDAQVEQTLETLSSISYFDKEGKMLPMAVIISLQQPHLGVIFLEKELPEVDNAQDVKSITFPSEGVDEEIAAMLVMNSTHITNIETTEDKNTTYYFIDGSKIIVDFNHPLNEAHKAMEDGAGAFEATMLVSDAMDLPEQPFNPFEKMSSHGPDCTCGCNEGHDSEHNPLEALFAAIGVAGGGMPPGGIMIVTPEDLEELRKNKDS